jgi:hypothetical protein
LADLGESPDGMGVADESKLHGAIVRKVVKPEGALHHPRKGRRVVNIVSAAEHVGLREVARRESVRTGHHERRVYTQAGDESARYGDATKLSSEDIKSNFCGRLGHRPRLLHQHFAADEDANRLWHEFEDGYALNSSVLALGSVPGDVSRMQALVEKLARGEAVYIVTFGNSFTIGHACAENEDQDQKECSWPNRARRWMEAAFPNSDIVWENRGESGTSTKSHLSMIGAYAHSLRQHPDLVILNSYLTDVMFTSQAPVYEKMILTIKSLFPKAQLLLIEDYFSFASLDDPRRGMQELRRKIARHYQIPLLDYGAMVQSHNREDPDGPDRFWPSMNPGMTGPGNQFTLIGSEWLGFVPHQRVTKSTCCPSVHPPWTVHQYYADAVANRILGMLGDVCTRRNIAVSTGLEPDLPKPFSNKRELEQVAVCTVPLSSYSARDQLITATAIPNGQSPILGGDWRLFEDKAGRPGWISTKKNSTISFQVRFGDPPSLLITHLKSYEGFGKAELKVSITHPHGEHSMIENAMPSGIGVDTIILDGELGELDGELDGPDTIMLDGKWGTRYSMPNTLSLLISEGGGKRDRGKLQALPSLNLSNAIADLRFRNIDGKKVKIISILTC